MKETTKAYLAGLVDGEGCITITKTQNWGGTKRRPQLSAKFCIVNSSKSLIESVLHDWGLGRIRKQVYKNLKYKATYIWEVQKTREILEALEYILPYLKLKRRQALLTIEFCKRRIVAPKGGRYTYAEREREIQKLVQILNQTSNPSILYKATNKISETVKAYIAGLMDGEGSMSICSHKSGITTTLRITNTSKNLLNYVVAKLKIGKIYEKAKAKSHWKQGYELHIFKFSEILDTLGYILPYLRLKYKHAHLMIEYCNQRLSRRSTHGVNSAYTKRDKEICSLMKELNGRS